MQTEHSITAEPHTHLAQRPPVENGLQWGSDPSFQYHGFSCPIGSWTEERLVRDMMRNFAFMRHSIDIDLNPNHEISQIAQNEPANREWSFLDDLDLPPQSSPSTRDFDVPSPSPDLKSNARSTTPESASATSICSPQRKKSNTPSTRKRKCVQKPGQVLCHCRTEKKRRETIGQGYERLSEIVPALRGQSFTRKYVLAGAANYVQELTDGNENLQRQLNEIKAKEDRLRLSERIN